MGIVFLLKMAFGSIGKNLSRAGLTILGVVIGIFAVVTLMALGEGAQRYILDQVATVGSNLIIVMPGKSESEFSAPPAQQGLTITSLKYRDAVDIREKADKIVLVSPEVRGQFSVTSPYDEMTCVTFGEGGEYFEIRNTKVVQGRKFDVVDVESMAKVVVIGPKVAQKLYPNQNPIGQKIKVNNVTFEIIGVTEDKGSEDGQDMDKVLYMPVTVVQKQILGIDYLFSINMEAVDENSIDLAKAQIANILRDNHSIDDPSKDDFTIYDLKQALKTIQDVTNVLSMLLAAIAAISLIVGGIGIMNIMLVSVTERTREIGLRKALGAKPGDILLQFLVEAIVLTLLGGLIGVLLSYATITVVTVFIKTFSPVITWQSILLAMGVSSMFGLVFGLYPANRASKLDPIQALRYE